MKLKTIFTVFLLLLVATAVMSQNVITRKPPKTQTTPAKPAKPSKPAKPNQPAKPAAPKPSKPATVLSRETITANGVSFEMVRIQGGTFTMGATSEQGSDAEVWEKPTHRVTLSDFSIGETEVTQALWQAVMGNNPSKFTGDMNRPVERVSWNDCQDFIRKLNQLTGRNFRLPTEAEWEYAARGGRSNGTKYAGSNDIGSVAWYDENCTHTVKTKSPNELGLYDMSGNVYEWCLDWYNTYSSSAQTNPQGPSSGSDHVFRGGSWHGGYAKGCRVSFRSSYCPNCIYDFVGFRLALSSTGTTNTVCSTCNGKGYKDCYSCNGKGQVQVDSWDESKGTETCKTCSGKGKVVCTSCNGTGRQ